MPSWINPEVQVSLAARRIYLLVIVCVVSSCATSPRQVLRQGAGPSVLEIMNGDALSVDPVDDTEPKHLSQSIVLKRPDPSTSTDHSAYTRDALNETRQLFPTLPNPTIALYVHAHPVVDAHTQETLPVPGYTTAFPLYRRVQFAMPGELPANRDSALPVFPSARTSDTDAPFSDTETRP